MERITFFILVCVAGILGAILTLLFSQNLACMLATIIGIPGLALLFETWLRERREVNERIEAELNARQNAISEFMRVFGIDHNRAEILYLAGFKSIDELKNRSIEELMAIEDINPTLAKRIYYLMQKME